MPEVVTGTGIGVVKHVGAAIAGAEATVIDAATTKAARAALPVWRVRAKVLNFTFVMGVPMVVEMVRKRVGQFGLEKPESTHPISCLSRKTP